MPLPLLAYCGLTQRAEPLFNALLSWRRAQGKEDGARLAERRGGTSLSRPSGVLIWIHAVSIGESNSALPLIEKLLAANPLIRLLLTTGTTTSASLMTERLAHEPRAMHQFIPLDHPRWVAAFLDHWRPDLALFVESEIWPNLIRATEKRGIPMILLNARMSERSFQRWQRFPQTMSRLLRPFAIVLAQNAKIGERLTALGAPRVECVGNLKLSSPALPVSEPELQSLKAKLLGRTCIFAASTHAGEELILAAAQKQLAQESPALLIIAPRHPVRAEEIAQELRRMGFKLAQRSKAEPVEPDTAIYLADTLGEFGLFFRLAPIVFMGGSFVRHGGQNPLEPARLSCVVLHGPHVENFAEPYARLNSVGGAIPVLSAEMIAQTVSRLIADPKDLERRRAAALTAFEDPDAILARYMAALEPFLPTPSADARA